MIEEKGPALRREGSAVRGSYVPTHGKALIPQDKGVTVWCLDCNRYRPIGLCRKRKGLQGVYRCGDCAAARQSLKPPAVMTAKNKGD
ncbi:hypothetical protein [Ideonella livida]|uniref:Uncharacterized protein n=1 Tax=Ideonella livida TaxID=2707176 RepID=A0A7C9TGM6_9BURK|nr:hypothetical protein [Ideonella livida]NDY89760.1 hypothetical protein [Ideonella livida]